MRIHAVLFVASLAVLAGCAGPSVDSGTQGKSRDGDAVPPLAPLAEPGAQAHIIHILPENDTAVVRWRATGPEDMFSTVEAGPNGVYALVGDIQRGPGTYKAVLTELAAGQAYDVRIAVGQGEDVLFRTLSSAFVLGGAEELGLSLGPVQERVVGSTVLVLAWTLEGADNTTVTFVEYGATAAFGERALGEQVDGEYVAVLVGLTEDSPVHVRIVADRDPLRLEGPSMVLRTAKASNEPRPTGTSPTAPLPSSSTEPEPTLSGFTVTAVSSDSASFSWTVSSAPAGVNSLVEVGVAGTFTKSSATQGGVGAQAATVFGLQSDQLYEARVRASNPSGATAVSSVIGFTTSLSPVSLSIPSVVAVGTEFLTLSWNVNGPVSTESCVAYGEGGLTNLSQPTTGTGTKTVQLTGLSEDADISYAAVSPCSLTPSTYSSTVIQHTAVELPLEFLSCSGNPFSPQPLALVAGKYYQVALKNNDACAHRLQILDVGYISPVLGPGQTYTYTTALQLPTGDYTLYDAVNDLVGLAQAA